MDYKAVFLKAFENIKRPGADSLLVWLLEETDFFTAPASARFHGSRPGGLVEHSVNVYDRLMEIAEREFRGMGEDGIPPLAIEPLAIMSLLHDLCKVNVYHEEVKRRKNAETGLWEEYVGYSYRDDLPLGHGEKSVYLIMRFMELNEEEALAIRWHMGAYDNAARGGSSTLTAAMESTELVWWLQEADMCATHIDEREAISNEWPRS